MTRLQVINGGRVTVKPSNLNQHERESYARRLIYHGGNLQNLARESGLSQTEIFWIAAEILRADSFENGMRAERARRRLMPPIERAAIPQMKQAAA